MLLLPKPFVIAGNVESTGDAPVALDAAFVKDWLTRWEKNILGDERNRYCDRELGEEIGWLVSLFLNGSYYGYQATHDPKWVEHLADWADSWIKRGVKEPDGFIGWPKSGSGGAVAESPFRGFRMSAQNLNALTDTSHGFQFGFLKGGVFWGWPSSHTTVTFAMSVCLITLYPKNKLLMILALIYAFYVGLGVSVSIHWFSEFVAGAIIGSVVGRVVGRSFREKLA